jgi:hypothetical protein
VTTPQDPGQPQYNPYGQPGSYRAGQQPGNYSSAPLPGQYPPGQYPAAQQAPAQQPPAPQTPAPQPYGYSPYGSPNPAGVDQGYVAPAKRPGIMVLGLVLMILASVPFVFGGLVGLLAPLDGSTIPPGVLDDPQLVAAGATPELLVSLVRVVAGVFVVVALVYVLFAVLAFRGRNWARILVTVLSVGFILLLVASLVGGTTSGGLLGFVAFVVVAVVAGVVILFLPDSKLFFAAPRRP